MTPIKAIANYLPFLDWLPTYRRNYLPGDIIAGLTVAVMLVPQSMAYALMVGLPPEVGLYSGIVPVLLYGLLGSARLLTFGPTAITSVLVLGTISQLNPPDAAGYFTLSLTLTLLLGVVFVVMGVLRLGFIVNLLSQPVMIGYMTSAGFIIVFSQLPNLLGVSIPRTNRAHELLIYTLERAPDLNLTTVAISVGMVAVLLFFKGPLGRILQRLGMGATWRFSITRSGPLAVVILSTLIVYAFNLYDSASVSVIGTIPAGLPRLILGPFDLTHLDKLLLGAVAIAFVGFMEGISTAHSFASRRRQRVDANQELFAMGMANLGAAFTGGFAGTTSISRSSVNFEAGANTGLSSVIAALVVTGVVLFLTPLFYYLPTVTLACIILVSVVNIINFSTVRQIWQYSRREVLPFLITFTLVLTTGIEIGILAGVGIAVFIHLLRTSRPAIITLGRADFGHIYRDTDRHDTMLIPGVLIVRVDESLWFANARYLDSRLRQYVATDPELDYLILAFNSVNTVDASALQLLGTLKQEFDDAGITVYFAGVKERVLERMERVYFVQNIGRERFFLTIHDAVQATGRLPDEDLPI